MTRFLSRPSALFIYFLVFSLIQGCAPQQPLKPADEETAQQPVPSTSTLQNAENLMQQASLAAGAERNQLLLAAAQLFTESGLLLRAEQALAEINPNLLSQYEQVTSTLLSTEIALNKGQSREALQMLQISGILPTDQQIKLLQLRARAFLDAGYPFESAKSRVQLDRLLTDSFDLELNHQAIWEVLSLLPATSLQQISNAPLNDDLLAWVELAKIAKKGQVDWQHLQDDIYQWKQLYPEHPAASIFIEELGSKQIELIEKPEHIAILLPLNGKYAQVSSAIRDGIMSAYYQHPDSSFQPRLTFIDTSDNQAAIWNYYKKATDQGADFIIGPFLKSAVDILARSSQMVVPTLTLNYTTEHNAAITNLFQFGLLPEDEARQSAEMAFRQGHTHAAILVPEGSWGDRLRNAFQQRFEELGGSVVSAQTYSANNNDFKRPIQSMLNINQSYSRYNSLKHLTGTKLQFTPYRRQDVDMIFMAATPKDARLLKPQFKFHYAGEIPVYATSHAFTGQLQVQADRDIDDLNFIDMPWILNAPGKFKQSLINLWPEQQRYTRFFALGVDAYNLIPFIGRLQNKSYERFSGQTGNLYIDPFNRIHRELLWARFERGIPKLIDISVMSVNLKSDEHQPQQPASQ